MKIRKFMPHKFQQKEKMNKGFILLILLVALVGMSGVVRASGVIPEMDLITSYSSIGGTPQYKDNDQDLIYKATQGDVITFSITPTSTPETINYLWQVMQGSQVVASSTEGTTYNWTVPSEISTWEIEIEVTLKDEVGNTKGRDFLSWSITTSEIKTVQPGESIQAAIDSLPPEGGVVELAAGTHNITTPIWINKSNVILRGQGIDKTIIDQNTIKTDGVIVSTFYDWYTRDEWLYQNMIKWEAMLKWYIDHPEELVVNTTIEKMTIYCYGSGFAAGSSSTQFAGIGGTEVKNLTISEVKIVGNSTDNVPIGISIGHPVDVTVKDSIIDKIGQGLYYRGAYRGNVINTTITNTKQFAALHLDGDAGLDGIPALIKGNRLSSNNGMLFVYSSSDIIVTENIIENLYARQGIAVSTFEKNVEVSKNIIRNIKYGSYEVAGILVEHKFDTGATNNITGNIIYNVFHGIAFDHILGGLTIRDTVYSNTIYGNGGNGIHNPQGQPLTSVKNNIIVNNGGYGINNVVNNVYNDVWNNTLGSYNGTSAGTGDISADPLFANPSAGDFHLKSQAGRWNGTAWVFDSETSPSIDAGDPADDYSNEPIPNGGRINMGAYGNTAEASKSGVSTIDINQDGTIDISDLRLVALHFGETTTSPYPRYDVNTDGTIDILDLRQVAGGM